MVTIVQVAEKAGVSPSYVSRYLNHSDKVSEESQQRIEKAIQELNYVPSRIARSLRTGTTNAVKIISPSITSPFFAEIFERIHRLLEKRNYDTSMQLVTSKSIFQPSSFADVDGVIMCFIDSDETVCTLGNILNSIGKPFAYMHWHMIPAYSGALTFDLQGGAEQTARHLLERGCRSIAYVDGPRDNVICTARYLGYCTAVPNENRAQNFFNSFNIDCGYKAAAEMVKSDRMPDGVVCGNDMIAAGVIKCLRNENIDVPGSVKVTGFDDIPLASMYSPSITSFAMPISQMTAAVVNTLLSMMEGNTPPPQHFCGALIPRESTQASRPA